MPSSSTRSVFSARLQSETNTSSVKIKSFANLLLNGHGCAKMITNSLSSVEPNILSKQTLKMNILGTLRAIALMKLKAAHNNSTRFIGLIVNISQVNGGSKILGGWGGGGGCGRTSMVARIRNFSQRLHENEKNLVGRGVGGWRKRVP